MTKPFSLLLSCLALLTLSHVAFADADPSCQSVNVTVVNKSSYDMQYAESGGTLPINRTVAFPSDIPAGGSGLFQIQSCDSTIGGQPDEQITAAYIYALYKGGIRVAHLNPQIFIKVPAIVSTSEPEYEINNNNRFITSHVADTVARIATPKNTFALKDVSAKMIITDK